MMKISLSGHSSTNLLNTPVSISGLQRIVVSDTFFFKIGHFSILILPLPVKCRQLVCKWPVLFASQVDCWSLSGRVIRGFIRMGGAARELGPHWMR